MRSSVHQLTSRPTIVRASVQVGKAGYIRVFRMIRYRYFLLFLLSAGPLQGVWAQCPADSELDVRMEVVRVADLRTKPVDFGTILINGDSGSVVMDRNGALRLNGGVIQALGYPQPGELTIDSDRGISAGITFDSIVDMGGGVEFRPQVSRRKVNLNGAPETIRIFGEMRFPMATQSGEHTGLLILRVTYY